jgi:16S rRNA processing protein RimM
MHAKKSAQQPPEYLVVGRIVRPHGVRGALIVEPLSSLIRSIEPNSQVFFGDPPTEETILQIRPHRHRYLITIPDCTSREQADRFRGLEIRLPFEQVEPLPEGQFYYWQILGLKVTTSDGQHLGEVVQILETGANDVYIVRDQEGQDQLIPAINQVIKRIDLDTGNLEVQLIPGLLDD